MTSDKGRGWTVDAITHENQDEWFRAVKLKLKSKACFFTCEQTRVEYCRIATANSTPDSTPESIATGVESLSLDGKPFLNMDKKVEYDKADAVAMNLIHGVLSANDRALVDEYDTAYRLWSYLKKKYTVVDAFTSKIHVSAILNFEWESDMTVTAAWEKMKRHQRKLRAADNKLALIYNDEALYTALTQALPEKFRTAVKFTFYQKTLTVEEKLEMLRQDEARDNNSAASDHGNAAFMRRSHEDKGERGRRSHGSPKRERRTSNGQCHLCKGSHLFRDCSYLEAAQAFVEEAQADAIRKAKRKPSVTFEASKRKESPSALSLKTKRSALVANPDSHDETSCPSSEDEEQVYLSHDLSQ